MLTPARFTVINYSHVAQLKAVKNPVEISGFRDAYLKDGAAFVRWVRSFLTIPIVHKLTFLISSTTSLLGWMRKYQRENLSLSGVQPNS